MIELSPAKTYLIRNRAGVEVAAHHRLDEANGKRIWWTRNGTSGLGGFPAADLPLYGIDEVIPGGRVIVTEGEKARDALVGAGFSAVATVCGASSTPSDTVLDDLKDSDVYLWPDNDDVGHEHMGRIAERLRGLGIPSRTITWGSQKGDDAYDLIELTGGQSENILDIISDAKAAPEPLFDPDTIGRESGERAPSEFIMAVRAADFVAADVTAPRYLVEGIWPEQAIGFISGQPKVFKSFLALDLAFALASGGMFLGRYQAPQPQRVLVIQNESSRSAFRDRLRSIGNRFGGIPEELCVITNYPILLDDETWIERMNRDLERIRPALMILDPLASMSSADENSATEVGDIVRLLREWRDKYEMAICIVHHTVKDGSGRRSGNKLRGSGALYGAAEVVVSMERPDDDAPRIAVRIEMKETESPKPFFAEFIPEGSELRIQNAEQLIATDQAIVDFLTSRGEATVADIATNLNLRIPIIREVVKTLGMRGIRLKPGTGTSNKPAIYYREVVAPLRLGIAEE